MMIYSRSAGGYSATSVADLEGWQVNSSTFIEGKGQTYCVRIALGKKRRAVYVSKSLGLTLQGQVRKEELQALLHKPKGREPQPESY